MSEERIDMYGILDDPNMTIEVETSDGLLKNISGFNRYIIFQGSHEKNTKGKIYKVTEEGTKFQGYVDCDEALSLIKKCKREDRGRGTILYDGRWRLWDWEKDAEKVIKKRVKKDVKKS